MIAVELINEAVSDGARLYKACNVLEITTRTYNRWKDSDYIDKRKGAKKSIPRKLSSAEQDKIEKLACSTRFVDSNPYEIVAQLLDEGIYIASTRTFYRVLKDRGLINHRRRERAPRNISKPPELLATGPDQVYSWDITWMKSEVNGRYYYAYMLMDIWSRKIVGWEVHNRESQDISSDMFIRLKSKLKLNGINLHSDNGNPMRGSTILATLQQLGVTPSFSRPRTSDDNPYSEALFKTLKYKIDYPKFFNGLYEARSWIGNFVNWYNTEHKHSGIGMITPEQRHSGKGDRIMAKRNRVMLKAYNNNPSRWSNETKNWNNIKEVYLNPSEETKIRLDIAV
jgi:transposase InsO family protein